MKKMILLMVLFWGVGLCAFAQNEKKMAVSLGPEWNMNSRYNFAGGAALNFDYNLPFSFAAGLMVTASNNLADIAVMEGAALFRRYFSGNAHTGFFAQADLGAYIVFEDGEITPLYMGGLRGGYRLLWGNLYIEPYGRLGYPFVFGVGTMAGIRF